MVENSDLCLPHMRESLSEYCHNFGTKKLERCGYPMVKNLEDMFIRFDWIHERDGQTYGRTDTARQHRPLLCLVLRGKRWNGPVIWYDMILKQLSTYSESFTMTALTFPVTLPTKLPAKNKLQTTYNKQRNINTRHQKQDLACCFDGRDISCFPEVLRSRPCKPNEQEA